MKYQAAGNNMDQRKVIEFVEDAIRHNYKCDRKKVKNFSLEDMQELLSILFLRVQAREEELNELVADLEKKVEIRTKELSRKNIELENLATQDELTKLFNRRYFNVKLREYSLLAKRLHYPLTCIMADIDFFKKCNDTYGHQAGDEVLEEFAGILSNNIRRTDVCARYGGEEFVILLPNTPLKNGIRLAEKIRKKVEKLKINYEGLIIKITASFGVASGEDEMNLGENLVRMSDDSLYEAKQNGRNQVRSADS